MAGLLDFLPTMQCLKYFLTTTWSREYPKTPWWTLISRICIYSVKNDVHLLFDLEQMAVILIFTHNVMSNIFTDNTTMSGIPENPMIDTKNKNLRLLWRKWYQFIAWPWINGGHFGFFTHNAISKILYDNTTMSGIPENPMIDTKNRSMPLLYRKWYQFIVWPWTNGRHLGFYPQCNVENIFWQYHYVRHTWTPQDKHQKHEYASIMSKMISIYCLTFDKWRPSWIFYPQCNVQSNFWLHY